MSAGLTAMRPVLQAPPGLYAADPAAGEGLRGLSAQALYACLMAHARFPHSEVLMAFAGVISRRFEAGLTPLIRGLDEAAFACLMMSCFPGIELGNGPSPFGPDEIDEFDDLVDLLTEHAISANASMAWLARAMATAAMGSNHLWQDMGLPSRAVLSQLMNDCFGTLARRNVGDMKWKKFFYRQLCEKTGIQICKSPNCQVCSDYSHCFGAED